MLHPSRQSLRLVFYRRNSWGEVGVTKTSYCSGVSVLLTALGLGRETNNAG